MRFKSIKLTNYIGIYNGLQLNEIYVDFSKCKHKMILIKGDNGSGKSTLFKALNPLPDTNDFFIPGMDACKELELYDENGSLYYLKFIHGVKNNSERDTTKAYIYKILNNGAQLDMNPNGNISSFKDILYDEFKLDSNFVALSQLSNEDRGLADKRPAERKKFVNAIIETLETYNNIHKTLSKRSNLLKSLINSITTKLDNLGNLEILSATLVALDEKIRIYNDKKNLMLERKADARATVMIIDPDNSIQNRFTELKTSLAASIDKERSISSNINNIMSKIDSDIDLNKHLELVNSMLVDITVEVQTMKNETSSLLADREADSQRLQTKIQRLQALRDETNITTIKKGIKDNTDRIQYCESIFDKIGVRDAIKISKEEYIIALNSLKDIKENIDYFKSDSSYAELQLALDYISANNFPDIVSTREEKEKLSSDIERYKQILIEINNRDNILTQLNSRPDDCVREDCGFVNSIKQSINGMAVERSIDIENVLNSSIIGLNLLIEKEKKDELILNHIGRIKTIVRTIENNRVILQKFNTGILHIDSFEIFRQFMNGESFKYIDELYSYINYANLFEEYKIYKENLVNFENQLSVYNSRNSIIDEITRDIEDLNSKLNDLTTKIENNNNTLYRLEQKQMQLTVEQNNIKTAISIIEENETLKKNIDSINKELDSINFNMDKIQKAMAIIIDCNMELNSLSNDLNIMTQDRDKYLHAIKIAEEYQIELKEYSDKYSLIEKIKYYSSPTSGIQLVFMELYMSKILILANELLSYLFEGRFVIQPFIITDTEFRIPVLGNGYMNDDITSLSSGEKAMISMIISLSLLYQSSTKYNILKLDEIDAPLDTGNRLQFILVLEKLIEILQAEQCIMISHNNEINTDNVDLIILRNTNGETYNGNIIYKY